MKITSIPTKFAAAFAFAMMAFMSSFADTTSRKT